MDGLIATKVTMISGVVVLLEHMSGFTALMQPWSLFISMAPNTTENRLYIVGPNTHWLLY